MWNRFSILLLAPALAAAQGAPSASASYPAVNITDLDGLARQAFRAYDRNGDGKLDRSEIRTREHSVTTSKGWVLHILDPIRWVRADRDADGLVTIDDITERYRARLEDSDRNGDGLLTETEWRATQGDEAITVCVTAPRCDKVVAINRAREKRIEEAGRRFERMDWSFRSAYRTNSGLTKPTYVAIRDYRSWHAIWDNMVARQGPKRASPAVDFSKEMVLVAATGTRPTTGHAIQIVSVRETPTQLLVTAVRTSPGKKCGAGGALTEPVDIVKVPISAKKIGWRFEDRAANCS